MRAASPVQRVRSANPATGNALDAGERIAHDHPVIVEAQQRHRVSDAAAVDEQQPGQGAAAKLLQVAVLTSAMRANCITPGGDSVARRDQARRGTHVPAGGRGRAPGHSRDGGSSSISRCSPTPR